MRTRGMRWQLAPVVTALTGLAACTSDGAGTGGAGTGVSTSVGGASAGSTSGTTSSTSAGGSGYCRTFAWGLDWPPTDAPAKEPALLEPASAKLDCGPGCRQMTTRLGLPDLKPYELHFAGSRMVASSRDRVTAVMVDLDAAQEVDLRVDLPEPGAALYGLTLTSDDCVTTSYNYYDDVNRRSYVCEACAHSGAVRSIAFTQGATDDAGVSIGALESNSRYIVLNQGSKVWAVDRADGSEHPLVSDTYYFTITMADPYIVMNEYDADVHLVDTRDWSDTNVSKDAAEQHHAASDGKTIVWIDEGYWPDTSIREVVVYDIATKTKTKITDGNVVPSDKWWPTVEGDWVAWMDNRVEVWSIWGYNLVTKKEYFLIGNKAGEFDKLNPQIPRLHRGKLYVIGSTPTYAQLFEIELPAP